MKQKATEAKGHSPTGGTPSQQIGTIHSISESEDLFLFPEFEDEVSPEMDRLLCATHIMNIYRDPIDVLKHLCGAFQFMAAAHLYHTANISRCLLKFHKGIHAVTFHSMSYDEVYKRVNFNKFPNKNVKTLVALEDLGRGSTGKAWLCVSVSQPFSAVCVLKFDNKDALSVKLQKEKEMWDFLYPELSNMVQIEVWSGSEALVMPHFSTVLESERDLYKKEIFQVLTTHFKHRGKVHNDVRWRNIGKYKKKNGAVALVVFDLYDIVDYDVSIHHDWIDRAIDSLFNI